jgi:hypothetical protein
MLPLIVPQAASNKGDFPMLFGLLNKARRPSSSPLTRRGYRPSLEGLEDRTVPSTVTWVSGNGDWDVASNWSTGTVPSAADDVDINVPGITITHAAATAHSVNSLTLEAGNLTRPDNLTVSGPFVWTGGTLAGPQGSSLTAAGGLDLSGPVTLDGRTLTNTQGQMTTWTGRTVTLADSAHFVNQGTFLDQTYGLFGETDNAGEEFVNQGTLVVATGSPPRNLRAGLQPQGNRTSAPRFRENC